MASGTPNSRSELLRTLSRFELKGIVNALVDKCGGDDVLKAVVSRVSQDKNKTEQEAASSSSIVVDKKRKTTTSPAQEITDEQRKKTKKTKKKKEFDMSNFAQRHVALHVGYFGENYRGFAMQQDIETIEHHLFRALEKCCLITDAKSCNFSKCGRTDATVSGLGQVVTLTVRSRLSNPLPAASTIPPANTKQTKTGDASSEGDDNELDYPYMLNKILPEDIFVLGWAPCPSLDYLARFNAQSRSYHYYFSRRDLDLKSMKTAASFLVGSHDFRNLCKMDVMNVRNYVRVIVEATIEVCSHDSSMCFVRIKGTAFLWHQIRCIVQVLFLVGRGLESPTVVKELLDVATNPGKPDYPMASGDPLILYASEYRENDLKWIYNPAGLQRIRANLDGRLARHKIKVSMTSDVLKFIDSVAPGLEQNQTDFPPNHKNHYENKSSYENKYVKLLDRLKQDTYEQKLEKLSDTKKAKMKSVHGWDV